MMWDSGKTAHCVNRPFGHLAQIAPSSPTATAGSTGPELPGSRVVERPLDQKSGLPIFDLTRTR
jgi:hypothetical protein